MIKLRLRSFGFSEWDYAFFEGENEETLMQLLLGRIFDEDYHIQIKQEDGTWENFE